jgi:hypothetical protein
LDALRGRKAPLEFVPYLSVGPVPHPEPVAGVEGIRAGSGGKSREEFLAAKMAKKSPKFREAFLGAFFVVKSSPCNLCGISQLLSG